MACIKNENQRQGRKWRGGAAVYLSISRACSGRACVEVTERLICSFDSTSPTRAKRLLISRVSVRILLLALFSLLGTGCSSFSNGKLLKQLQNDNERLLSEFRAERTRREDAERTAMQLEQRLAESEKLLARQSGTTAPQRISSLQSGSRLPATTGSPPYGSSGPSNSRATSELDSDDAYQNFQWQRRYK